MPVSSASAESRGARGDCKARSFGNDDRLNVAKVESLVMFVEAVGFYREQMVGAGPQARRRDETAAAAGQGVVAQAGIRRGQAPCLIT